VSTEEQGDSGAGLEAQRRAIAAECKRRGWQLLEVIEDAGFSAKDLKRPGIKEALRVLEEGDAKALVAAKLDRLSRSMIDFTALMATAQKQGSALVALDCAVDTTTPAGEAMANVLATFAQFEPAAYLGAHPRGAGDQAGPGRSARPAQDDAEEGRQQDQARAGPREDVRGHRRRPEPRRGANRTGRRSLAPVDRAIHAQPGRLTVAQSALDARGG